MLLAAKQITLISRGKMENKVAKEFVIIKL